MNILLILSSLTKIYCAAIEIILLPPNGLFIVTSICLPSVWMLEMYGISLLNVLTRKIDENRDGQLPSLHHIIYYYQNLSQTGPETAADYSGHF